MFHFILFLGSFAANFVAMWRAPVDSAPLFYSSYAIASALGSLLTTGVFTFLKQSRYLKIGFILGITLLTLVEVSFQGSSALVPALYAGTILLGDYGISQSGARGLNTIYRFVMILTTLLFFVPNLEFNSAILIRSGIAFLFFSTTLGFGLKYSQITLKAPWKFTALAYIFYSGTLILLPRLEATNEVIKNWYLITQLGLALILKVADFTSRSIYSITRRIEFVTLTSVISLLFLGLFLTPSFLFASVYCIGAAGLWFAVKRYAIIK